MDRVTLQSELASQQATYDGAKAEYEYQKKNYERKMCIRDRYSCGETNSKNDIFQTRITQMLYFLENVKSV